MSKKDLKIAKFTKTANKKVLVSAIKEKCKECMADYVDGKRDCQIFECALYAWMPYGIVQSDDGGKK